MPRPRLLFISPRFLFPTNEGGKIRTANMLRQMKDGAFELILASPEPQNRSQYADEIQRSCDRFVGWPASESGFLIRCFRLASSLPVSVANDWSHRGAMCVARLLAETPDVVVIDFPHAAVLLPKFAFARTSVIFTHNVEAEIFERHARIAGGVKRLIWQSQSRKMEAYEQKTLRSFDTVIAVSQRDARAIRSRYGAEDVQCVDTGVDIDSLPFHSPRERADASQNGGTIVFTGAMDTSANIDGMSFLMEKVWPLVAQKRPLARGLMVGRNPAKWLKSRASALGINWTFTGLVDDVRPYIVDADVSVIPLRVGSGTRIKAFEAMALGRPVVSTSVGVEGLEVVSGRHYLAADTPVDMANAILRLLGDRDLRERLAVSARCLLEESYSWERAARQLEQICLGTLKNRTSA
jgi:glycosyltransferase involved in cell wall biosynthesis